MNLLSTCAGRKTSKKKQASTNLIYSVKGQTELWTLQGYAVCSISRTIRTTQTNKPVLAAAIDELPCISQILLIRIESLMWSVNEHLQKVEVWSVCCSIALVCVNTMPRRKDGGNILIRPFPNHSWARKFIHKGTTFNTVANLPRSGRPEQWNWATSETTDLS